MSSFFILGNGHPRPAARAMNDAKPPDFRLRVRAVTNSLLLRELSERNRGIAGLSRERLGSRPADPRDGGCYGLRTGGEVVRGVLCLCWRSKRGWGQSNLHLQRRPRWSPEGAPTH